MNTLFVLVELVLCRTPLLWIYAPFLPVVGLLYTVCCLFSLFDAVLPGTAASKRACPSLTSPGQAEAELVHATQGFFSKSYTPKGVLLLTTSTAYPFLNPEVVGNKVPLYVVGVGIVSVLFFTIMSGVGRLRDWFRPTAKGIPPSMSEKVVEGGEKLCVTISKESITTGHSLPPLESPATKV